METKRTIIHGGKIILRDRVLDGGTIVCENGKITDILEKGTETAPSASDVVIDAEGKYVSPGFIDMHIHGGGEHDFMDGTPEAFLRIAEIHAKHGTTSMVPTTLTSSDKELFTLLDVYKSAKQAARASGRCADFLGLHLEGPFLNPAQCGAQDTRYLRNPDKKLISEVMAKSDDIVRWSVAPELEGGIEFGRSLKDHGIVASIAHTAATYDTVVAAFNAGYSLMTHFYCAMSTITKKGGFRFPGVIESGYLIDDMDLEIIADGCHLPAPLLQFVCKFKDHGRITLCTDAMRAAGMPEGEYLLGSLTDGQKVVVEDGVAKLMDRSAFAGSVSTTDRLVRTMVDMAGLPIGEAVQMITANPARILGIQDRKGSIAKGMDADLVVFDSNIRITTTISYGNIIFGE